MTDLYVQHRSGDGEKWKVSDDYERLHKYYKVKDEDTDQFFYLPKSEYVEVPAPEHWMDVTVVCEVTRTVIIFEQDDRHTFLITYNGLPIVAGKGWRVRKQQVRDLEADPALRHPRAWAFTVEHDGPL